MAKAAKGAATSATSGAVTRMVDNFTRKPGQSAPPHAVYRGPVGPAPSSMRTYLLIGGCVVGALGLALVPGRLNRRQTDA